LFPSRCPFGMRAQTMEDLGKLTWAAAHLPDAVVIASRRGVVEFVNPAFEALASFAGIRAVGRTLAVLSTKPHWADLYQGLRPTILERKVFRGVLAKEGRNGEFFHTEWVISPFPDAAGPVTHLIAIGRDVTDRVHLEHRLKHIAEHDALTGLPNRSLFLDRLAQLIKHSGRRGCGFALAMIDVDRLKAINDSLGHPAGDALLRAVAHRIQWCIRDSDTLGRLGGDEFGLILVDVQDRRAAVKVAAKIIAAFQAPVRLEQRAVRASVSLGACVYSEDGVDQDDLLNRADAAMYSAKKAGGNRYWFQQLDETRSAAPYANLIQVGSLP